MGRRGRALLRGPRRGRRAPRLGRAHRLGAGPRVPGRHRRRAHAHRAARHAAAALGLQDEGRELRQGRHRGRPRGARAGAARSQSGVRLIVRGPATHLYALRVVLMLGAVAFLVWHVLSNGRSSAPHGVEHGSAGLSSSSGGEESAAGVGLEPADVPLTSIAGTFVDSDGHARALSSFRGVPFVASAIYTRCPSVCPRTVAALERLARSFPVGDAPSFVLFSLDPAHDTPQALRAFAGAHALSPPRWTLLQPDTSALREIAHALGLAYSGLP